MAPGSQLVEGALVSLDVGHDAEPLLCRGVRLARQSTYVEAANHSVVIFLPAWERPVETVVEIRRETDRDLGMRFLKIEPDDRVRLEQAAIAWTRTRLRLAPGAAGA